MLRNSSRKKMRQHEVISELIEQCEKFTVSIRAKVEHQFRVIKRQFGFTKTKYRGLNESNLCILFALSNLKIPHQSLRH